MCHTWQLRCEIAGSGCDTCCWNSDSACRTRWQCRVVTAHTDSVTDAVAATSWCSLLGTHGHSRLSGDGLHWRSMLVSQMSGQLQLACGRLTGRQLAGASTDASSAREAASCRVAG
jgi:hypothetical protein